ncbi:MAG: 1-acyl-sn-glycerol-3-phosphate acyltransferase [Bacteroidales bacterium]|nr:1-acyl-sn-glycerol-3-phosphate acyltransferase [Bacteroidales bacterium]
MEFDYSDIRYYGEDDLKPALERVIKEPTFSNICNFMTPGISKEDAEKKVLSYTKIKNFQVDFILKIIKKLISRSITNLSSENANNFSSNSNDKYLFISNHRNIVMDAALINHELHAAYDKDFESTAIAIGNNLLGTPWIKDMARLNKSFVVIRDSSVQKMLENSIKLSTYMRSLIMEQKSSVWLAQREGRAKNGNDVTQPGLLKMLQMSGSSDFVENYGNLHIVPVSISYENDPCISNKVNELCAIEVDGKYDKTPMDDYNSMYNGLMGFKGRVHINFGNEITKDVLKKIDEEFPRKNEKIKSLAEYIDGFVHKNYKLWPKNYVATDIINNDTQFEDFYTSEDKTHFIKLMADKIKDINYDEKLKQDIFLKMWATPVKNSFKNSDKYKFTF